MIKFLTCASYYGTGSSAVTDLISEYDGVDNLTDYEFRFLHDPYGVRDLQYYLIDNPNRHNSGFGLKKFIKYTKFLEGNALFKRYRHFLGDAFATETKKYVDSLITTSFNAYWQYDLLERGKTYYFFSRLFYKIFRKDLFVKNIKTYVCNVDKDYFIERTKEYAEGIFKNALTSPDNFLMVDQIVPSSNIEDFLPYFNDIRIFLVDRDPRDLYLSEKYVWREGVVPASPEEFVEWYKYCRKDQKRYIENENVCFLRFEDMIYDYENTKRKIVRFAGIDEERHANPLSKFNPEISKKNTKLYLKYPQEKENIKIIEERLSEYLYNS